MMRSPAHSGISLILLAGLLAAGLPVTVSAADNAAGEALFRNDCFACHGDKGQGIAGIAPALAGPLALSLKQEEGRNYVSRVLIYGLSGRIVSQGQTFTGAMPVHSNLSDVELAGVANYLAQNLNGVPESAFKPEDFAHTRSLKPAPTHKELRELRSRVMP
jgi:mono/diheme cytochrome c family protein